MSIEYVELTITDSEPTQITISSVGDQGIPGTNGQDGIPGPNEITPYTDTTINGPIIGDAVTGKARGPLDSDFLVGPPLVIADGETYRVPANQQVGFRFDMVVDGDLVVDGILYEV